MNLAIRILLPILLMRHAARVVAVLGGIFSSRHTYLVRSFFRCKVILPTLNGHGEEYQLRLCLLKILPWKSWTITKRIVVENSFALVLNLRSPVSH